MAEDQVAKIVSKWSKATGLEIRSGNRVDALVDGPAALKAMHDAIRTTLFKDGGSGYYIYLLGWYLDDLLPLVPGGASLYGLFEEAADFHVQMRVMLWDQLGGQNSAAIDHINALRTGAGTLDNNTLWPDVGSHHQKILVVRGREGLIGFCGGVDINKDRIVETGEQAGSPMHDVHCRIVGDAAHDLVDVFVQRWLAHPEHNKIDSTTQAGKTGLLGLKDRTPPGDSKPSGSQYVAIARTFNFVAPWQKCAKEHSIRTLLLGAIAAATKYIYIEDQYLWNLEAAAALGNALSHIQHLTVVISHSFQVQHGFSNSIAVPDGGAAEHRQFFNTLKSNSRPADWNKFRVFHRVTPSTTTMGPHSYVHAKTMIFDDELAVIGSANCNRRGWESDSEVCVAIFDLPASLTNRPFATWLRIQLWREHLGLSEDQVKDWLGGAKLWPTRDSKPAQNCAVMWYDLANDGLLDPIVPQDAPPFIDSESPSGWDRIDPGDGVLRSCGAQSVVAPPNQGKI